MAFSSFLSALLGLSSRFDLLGKGAKQRGYVFRLHLPGFDFAPFFRFDGSGEHTGFLLDPFSDGPRQSIILFLSYLKVTCLAFWCLFGYVLLLLVV